MAASRLTILVIAAALVLSVPALSLLVGGSAGAAAPVRIALDEYSIAAPATLPAGRASLETLNRGRIEHELLIVRTDVPAGDLPVGLDGPAPELAGKVVLGRPHGHSGHGGTSRRGGPSRHIRTGESLRESVDLRPGRYVLLCSLPGHYEAGQHAALVVR